MREMGMGRSLYNREGHGEQKEDHQKQSVRQGAVYLTEGSMWSNLCKKAGHGEQSKKEMGCGNQS